MREIRLMRILSLQNMTGILRLRLLSTILPRSRISRAIFDWESLPRLISTSHKTTPWSVTRLPDSRYLHVLPEFETLFPGAYCSAGFVLAPRRETPLLIDGVLRVFSSVGSRDFPLRLNRLKKERGI